MFARRLRGSLLVGVSLAVGLGACVPAPTATQLRAHNNRSEREEEDTGTEGGEGEEEDEAKPEVEAEAEPREPLRLEPPPLPEIPPIEDCEASMASYAQFRDGLNRCSKDDDCSELESLVCPLEPTYIGRFGQTTRIFSWEQALVEQCPEATDCKARKRKPLGPARCVKGHCVRGRPKIAKAERGRCWDIPVTFIEPGEPRTYTAGTDAPDSPRLAVSVPTRGRVTLDIDYRDCPTCSVDLTRLQPIGGAKVGKRRIRRGNEEMIEFKANRGVYFLHVQPRAGGAGQSVEIQAWIASDKERGMATNRHGKTYLRRCEAAQRTKSETSMKAKPAHEIRPGGLLPTRKVVRDPKPDSAAPPSGPPHQAPDPQ